MTTGVPLEAWSDVQLYLLAGVDPKVRPTCGPAPRLPEGAQDGVLCRPPGVEELGFYAFLDRDQMNALYFMRLREYGVVERNSGGCGPAARESVPGEAIDLGAGDENHPSLPRYGCYIDELGRANARFVIPAQSERELLNVYVGAVGVDGSISQLFKTLFPLRETQGAGCGWCLSYLWSVSPLE